jgi:hypothetical protein
MPWGRTLAEPLTAEHEHSEYQIKIWITLPPLFSRSMDPLEADEWLCTTRSKFGLLHYIEYQKTLYATHQLRGSAGAC